MYWQNNILDEIVIKADTKEVVVKIYLRYFRKTKVEELLGDSSKARKKLKWQPKISLKQLISEMIKEDYNETRKEYILKNKGFPIYSSKE